MPPTTMMSPLVTFTHPFDSECTDPSVTGLSQHGTRSRPCLLSCQPGENVWTDAGPDRRRLCRSGCRGS